MSILYFDTVMDEQRQRQELYDGRILVYSPRPSTLALCAFARELTEEAFGAIHPTVAQHYLSPDEYAEILNGLKAKFINHPYSKELVLNILRDLGCDLDKTYFDLPRMRTATSHGYLTTGIAYAFDPHRDTWFSAPHNQLNWWIPMYDLEAENCLAFYPSYWQKPVPNESEGYDCRQWLAESRRLKAAGIADTRRRPRPLEHLDESEELRLLCQVGGLLLFSGAHLHGTVPNTSGLTRFSIDFRTVHLDDVASRTGAPNVDGSCTGTLMGDFIHPLTRVPVPEPLIALYEAGMPAQTDATSRPRQPAYAPADYSATLP